MPVDDGCGEVFVGDDLGGQAMAHDHRREDADLAVIDLRQATVPLPRHARGPVPLLPERALVQKQSAGVAEVSVGIDHQSFSFTTQRIY